jgi:hypothetical protein
MQSQKKKKKNFNLSLDAISKKKIKIKKLLLKNNAILYTNLSHRQFITQANSVL